MNRVQLEEKVSLPCSTRTLTPGSERSVEMAWVKDLAKTVFAWQFAALSSPCVSRSFLSSSSVAKAGTNLDGMPYAPTALIRIR